jgi:hypothetical protein
MIELSLFPEKKREFFYITYRKSQKSLQFTEQWHKEKERSNGTSKSPIERRFR